MRPGWLAQAAFVFILLTPRPPRFTLKLLRRVILSGARTSRSEVPAESKDPYILLGRRVASVFDSAQRVTISDEIETPP